VSCRLVSLPGQTEKYVNGSEVSSEVTERRPFMVTMVRKGVASGELTPTVTGTRVPELQSEEFTKIQEKAYVTPGTRRRLAWGAVIAGALTALALLLLSNMFAIACDISAFRGGAYGWGAGVWSVISYGVAFFLGGMVVEYLTRRGEARLGALHGVLVWVLAVNLAVLLSAPAIGFFHAFIPVDAFRFVGAANDASSGSINAAAWGVAISVFVGLPSAALGGIAGCYTLENTSMER
jgi:hypothetical protein